jgi:hypothetical protein
VTWGKSSRGSRDCYDALAFILLTSKSPTTNKYLHTHEHCHQQIRCLPSFHNTLLHFKAQTLVLRTRLCRPHATHSRRFVPSSGPCVSIAPPIVPQLVLEGPTERLPSLNQFLHAAHVKFGCHVCTRGNDSNSSAYSTGRQQDHRSPAPACLATLSALGSASSAG